MTMYLQLSPDEIAATDLSPLYDLVDERCRGYMERPSGGTKGEHYKLLAELSNWFEGELLLDIGTFRGGSALSLAMNRKNRVVTIDTHKNKSRFSFGDYPITPEFYNATNLHEYRHYVDEAKLIVLDISHNGDDERKFYEELLKTGFDGFLVLDDIYLQRDGDMKGFWESIEEPKMDLTRMGHCTGTGLVHFSNMVEILE